MSQEIDKIIYSMIRVSKKHGQKEVLKDISLSYFYGAKIGVLGLNGSGKSSLLKILAGEDQSFDGKTVLAPGYTIGYLPQEPLVDETRTVREVVEEGLIELVQIRDEYEAINAKFSEPHGTGRNGRADHPPGGSAGTYGQQGRLGSGLQA